MKKKGFTLTELLIVIVIIAIVTIIAIPNIIEALYENKRKGGESIEKLVVKNLQLYNSDNEEDLWCLEEEGFNCEDADYTCVKITPKDLYELNPDINMGDCLFRDADSIYVVKSEEGNYKFYTEIVCGNKLKDGTDNKPKDKIADSFDPNDLYYASPVVSDKLEETCVYEYRDNTYTIRYNANGGEGVMEDSYYDYSEEKPLRTNIFSRDNYEFIGWSRTSESQNAEFQNGQVVSKLTKKNEEIIVLYAVWKELPNIYSVTLDNQDATSGGTKTTYYRYNTVKKINNVDCYYYTNDELSICLTGGNKINTPTKTGYEFKGYYTQKDGKGTKYINEEGTIINDLYKTEGDKTLYAYWVDETAPSIPTYTAFYQEDGSNYVQDSWTNKKVLTTISSTDNGSGVKYIQYQLTTASDTDSWTTFQFSEEPLTKINTTWTGTESWDVINGRNQSYYFRACDESNNCSGNSEVYTIKYDTSDPVSTIKNTSSTKLTLNYSDNVGVVAYYFGTENPSTKNVEYTNLSSLDEGSIDKTISSAGTYYFSTKDSAGNSSVTNTSAYTVTYNGNGGTVATTSQFSLSGTNVILPTPKARTGYNFNGWYTAASGGNKVGNAGDSYTVSTNQTLYAQWTAITYTITYNSNAGLPSGYKILSYVQSSGSQYINTGVKTDQDSRIIVKASYTGSYSIYGAGKAFTNYTANASGGYFYYNDYGGGASTATNYSGSAHIFEQNKNYAYIDNNLVHSFTYSSFTSPGNMFLFGRNDGTGALNDAGGTVKIYSAKIYNGSLVRNLIPCINTAGIVGMYDTVEKKFYSNAGSGTFVASENYVSKYNITNTVSLPSPAKTGYTFGGWYTSADFTGTKITSISAGTTGNKTLYAKWTPNNYTVTFNANGGSVSPTSKTVTYDGEYGTLPLPTKSGYTFVGWYTGKALRDTSITYKEKPWIYYADRYKDLYDAFGYNETSLQNHYQTYGKNEGRKISEYNVSDIYSVVGNQTLYAGWTAGTGIAYKVQHWQQNLNGTASSQNSSNYTLKETEHFTGTTGESVSPSTKTYTGFNSPSKQTATVAADGSTTINYYYTRKSKSITFKIAYDTSTYRGPSSHYSSSTYQSLSKTSTTLNYGGSETMTASPAYPDDRYVGSVSCSEGITSSITTGSGTTSRTDSIKVTNNSNTTTASVCTITYTPKWEGIPYGSYTANDTLSYAGSSWTIKADNGNNTGLVLNTNAGIGAYKSNIQTELGNSSVNKDVSGGGIVAQSTGAYVSTDGGISTGYTGANYWTDSTHFYNSASRTFYSRASTKYLYGSWNGRGSGSVSTNDVYNTLKTSATLSTGIKSTTSSYYTINGSTITFKNASKSSSDTDWYYSLRMTRFRLGSGSYDGQSSTPNSYQLAYLNYRYSYSASSGYTLTHTALIGDTGRVTMYICGGNYHSDIVVYRYKSSSAFYYGSEASGTGWSGSSWDVDNAVSYSYVYNDERWNGRYAGYASTCGGMAANIDSDCVNNYASNGELQRIRRYRFHSWDDHYYCKKRTKYTLANVEKSLYYRPYLIARER